MSALTLVNTRSGGAYIPPGRLRLMQQQQLAELAPDSEQVQRISWDALKKSINGLINKVNASNIKAIVPELFSEDLVRGRGLFCRSIMKAQSLALPFTPVYAAVVAVVNTKLPQVGELLVHRVVHQFRRAYRRNDRPQCLALLTLLAHLVNQQIVHEILALQVLALLLERPTADSVELAVGLARECGQYLEECASRAFHAVFDRFRDILHQADIDKRVQYMVEVLFQVRKDKFKDNPTLDPSLDLVEDDDRIIHEVSLDDEIDPEEMLGIFSLDPNYLENQQKYQSIKREILGSDDEGDEEGSSEEEESEEEAQEADDMKIIDKTGTNLVNLRRTIYLTVMSSVDFEECAHKLMKLKIEESDEVEVCTMIVECCSQERTYTKFYGLLGERFCKLNIKWAQHFEHVFMETYDSIHRYETNRLRSVAKFFAHIFAGDAIPLPALSVLRLTEDATTASSRIFIKIMFQEMVSFLGLNTFNEKLHDPTIYPAIQPGLFPTDNPKNTRFAINYYTSIGLGALTDNLRQSLQEAAAQAALVRTKRNLGSDSESDSDDSSSDSSSSNSSDSSDESSNSDSPPRRARGRSRSNSVTRTRHRSRQATDRNTRLQSSRSPASKKPLNRKPSISRSRSPQRTFNRRDRRSPSPIKRTIRESSRSRSPIRAFSRRDRSLSPIKRPIRESSRSRSPRRSFNRRDRSLSPIKRPIREPSRSRSPRKTFNRRDRSISPIRRSIREPSRSRSPRKTFNRRDRSFSPVKRPIRQLSRSRSPRKTLDRRIRSPSPIKRSVREPSRSRSPRRSSVRRDRSLSPIKRSIREVSRSRSPRRTVDRHARSPSPIKRSIREPSRSRSPRRAVDRRDRSPSPIKRSIREPSRSRSPRRTADRRERSPSPFKRSIRKPSPSPRPSLKSDRKQVASASPRKRQRSARRTSRSSSRSSSRDRSRRQRRFSRSVSRSSSVNSRRGYRKHSRSVSRSSSIDSSRRHSPSSSRSSSIDNRRRYRQRSRSISGDRRQRLQQRSRSPSNSKHNRRGPSNRSISPPEKSR